MSTINFNQIPSNINVPLFYISIGSDSASQVSDFESGSVLLGLTNDSNVNDDLVRVGTVAQANRLFGAGSQLSTMVAAYRANNRYGPLYAIGQEASDGKAAFCTLLIKATNAKAGTLILYVAGRRLSVVVRSGDTATEITRAIKELVDNDDSLPFTAITTATAYAPLPIHPEDYELDDPSFNSAEQHNTPTAYVQPGVKYKKDPRNSATSSIYYIAYADSDLYRSLPGPELTSGTDIFINTKDLSTNSIDNPNSKGTPKWTHYYTGTTSTPFDYDDDIDPSVNYPGDIQLPDNGHFVRFVSKWKGAPSNDYTIDLLINTNNEVSLKDVQISYATETIDEETADSADFDGNNLGPLNNSINFVGGSGTYDYDLEMIKEIPYHLLVFPENSVSADGVMHTDLADLMEKLETRWEYNVQNYGHGIGAIVNNNDYSDYSNDLPSDFRSPSFSMFYMGNTVTPVCECAAAVAGAMFNQVRANPKLPYHGIRVQGIVTPSVKDAPNIQARERLLKSGISTTKLIFDVVIERPVTGDPKWRDLSRRLAAAYIATDMRDYVLSRVGNAVTTSDASSDALPGSGVITLSAIHSILVIRAQSLVSRGYLESFNPRDIVVERDFDDPTRINIAINVDPTNPLYVLASDFAFAS